MRHLEVHPTRIEHTPYEPGMSDLRGADSTNDDEPVFFGQPFLLVAIIPDRVDGTARVG